MRKTGFILSIALIIFLMPSAGYSQTKKQKIFRAKRAAQIDAYKKLGETIKELRIDSNTYVSGFVTESDQIYAGFEDFIKDARIINEPRFYDGPDGSIDAEVDVQLTIDEVVRGLARLNLYRGYEKEPLDFNNIKKYTDKKEFTATGKSNSAFSNEDTGYGTARNMPEENKKTVQIKKSVIPDLPGWKSITLPGKIKAEKDALDDARNKLSEIIANIQVAGNIYVRDFVAENEDVKNSMDAFVNDLKQTGPYGYYEDAIVKVNIEVSVEEIVKELETMRQRLLSKGHRWNNDIFRSTSFDDLIRTNQKIINVQGTAKAGKVTSANTLSGKPADVSSEIDIPQWAMQTARARGISSLNVENINEQTKINAENTAWENAKKNLIEKVYGVKIDSDTAIRDISLEDYDMNSRISAYISEAKRSGKPVYNEDGTVEVEIELPLEGVWKIINRRR